MAVLWRLFPGGSSGEGLPQHPSIHLSSCTEISRLRFPSASGDVAESNIYSTSLKYIKQMYDCQQAFSLFLHFLFGNTPEVIKGMITLTNPYITTKLCIPTHNQSRFIDLFKFPYWTNKSTAAIMTETMSLTVCATATPVNPNIACMIYRLSLIHISGPRD